MNEDQIEEMLKQKGLNSPRLSPAYIDAMIIGETYTALPSGKSMVCELTLINGLTVRGESACVSNENFDEAIVRDIARENAKGKIWELEGYLLQERVHNLFQLYVEIARVCHEANRAYCQSLGDDSQLPWDNAPEWQKKSALLGVDLHATNPDAGPKASHDSWKAQKEADGWVYGEVKDADKKTHPCMMDFDQLPVEQQAKDYIFRAIVIEMTRIIRGGGVTNG